MDTDEKIFVSISIIVIIVFGIFVGMMVTDIPVIQGKNNVIVQTLESNGLTVISGSGELDSYVSIHDLSSFIDLAHQEHATTILNDGMNFYFVSSTQYIEYMYRPQGIFILR